LAAAPLLLFRPEAGPCWHVSARRKKHLNLYLAEFDFRQDTRAALGIDDVARAKAAIRGTLSKRLTYRDSSVL
jgi:hypothetical protein